MFVAERNSPMSRLFVKNRPDEYSPKIVDIKRVDRFLSTPLMETSNGEYFEDRVEPKMEEEEEEKPALGQMVVKGEGDMEVKGEVVKLEVVVELKGENLGEVKEEEEEDQEMEKEEEDQEMEEEEEDDNFVYEEPLPLILSESEWEEDEDSGPANDCTHNLL